MNDRPPEDGDGRDDPYEGVRGGSWISSLIDALERFEDRSRSGRSGLDYDVSIRSGLEGLGGESGLSDRAGRPSGSPAAGRGGGGDRSGGRRSAREDYHVSTRTYENEVVLTADISGADPDDVTVGFDDATLVVAVAGRAVERVHIPWASSSANAVVRNGVLTVRVEPDGIPEGEDR